LKFNFMSINPNSEQFIEGQTIILPRGFSRSNALEVGKDFKTLVNRFIDYATYETDMSPRTVTKYRDCLKSIIRDLPFVHSPTSLTADHITMIKKSMTERAVGNSGINGVIFALRKFLNYCREIHRLETIHPKDIKPQKIKKREVEYLRSEEVEQLLSSIPVHDVRGLRMRALMELLLATGMRISECLSINRNDIDWEHKEIKIIGKGNKERTVYFTDRAAEWVQKYLDTRNDNKDPLFLAFSRKRRRLTQYDMTKMFRHYVRLSGIRKRVTPHILRHTMATLMLHNGCDITYIKEILGHSDIETTAKYYLGTDKRAVKDAHRKFMRF